MLIIQKKILGKEPTQRLDNTTITGEAKYSFNLTESKKKCFVYVCVTMEVIGFCMLMV